MNQQRVEQRVGQRLEQHVEQHTEGRTSVLLSVEGLKTQFFSDEGIVKAVDGVDLTIRRGTTLCVVGESGCGKSVLAHSILQLVSRPGRIVAGHILLYGEDDRSASIDLATLDPKGPEMRHIRGGEIAMIFQEPMSSLSPVHTIGAQMSEILQLHFRIGKQEARVRGIEVLRQVNISRPEENFDSYTFHLSGGMRQRAMIALALSCNPRLLIADEPTTALDVTTQAQILSLIGNVQRERDMAVLMITHDLGVVAEIADEVAVMYLGTVVERGSVDEIFHDPKHPYTRALLRSIPPLTGKRSHEPLPAIRGNVPHPFNRPAGCPFHTRCDEFMPGVCDTFEPPPIPLRGSDGERDVRCLLYGGAGETRPVLTDDRT